MGDRVKAAGVVIALLVAVVCGLVAVMLFGGLAADGVVLPREALWGMVVAGGAVFAAVATLGLAVVGLLDLKT
ncbi:hypothetical protein [Catenuloplanes atrovinosus]|uniref:Membrane protein n=1 Tax=Catenuloplanes atrovinosus TaxID=137266 RepID=A0AAE3YXR2_9ACTN|nr:hypothetical protein [Catenuloplanes atrovinosus]MDR7281137.1 putative membrane protein [Catenuloplanes atrovinosus]